MSIPQKGRRSIVVEQQTFHWYIRKRPTSGNDYWDKKLAAVIELKTDLPKGKLYVDFAVSPPGNWRRPHKTAITPTVILMAIQNAMEEGWNPLEKSTFNLIFPVKFVPDPKSTNPDAKFDIRFYKPNR